MVLIREFETMLDGFKREGNHRGISPRHGGPAHLFIGAVLYRTLEAADELAAKHELAAGVMDVRVLNPLHYKKIVASVKHTGKAILASDACERGSFLHTITSNINQMTLNYLDGLIYVASARNWITQPA